MPEDILYVLEKFLLAVTELATSQRDLRARLADAYMSNFVQLKARDLPEEIRQEFQGLGNALAATLSDDEAQRLIRSIISMYVQVVELAKDEG
jgi:hypothetical protein